MTLASRLPDTLAADSQTLDKLRHQARQAPEQALESVAQQFEMVFLNMMLKGMREATPQDGVMDSEQTRMFTGMLDQQLAQEMSRRGVGLADMMVRQLGPQAPAGSARSVPGDPYRSDPQAFVDRMRPHAEQASRSTGIAPQLMLGQAALESGWGKREIRLADGSNSHNLFGIKAGKEWQGRVAEVTTTEYHDGKAAKQVERFRAYPSYAEAFADYARLLNENPRYAGVRAQQDAAQFAQSLQRAGYATDPNYADKLLQVIGRIDIKA